VETFDLPGTISEDPVKTGDLQGLSVGARICGRGWQSGCSEALHNPVETFDLPGTIGESAVKTGDLQGLSVGESVGAGRWPLVHGGSGGLGECHAPDAAERVARIVDVLASEIPTA
jgi:hypothetical protein